MSNWPLLSLGEIFDIARGGSPRPIDQFITSDDDGVNWIMIGDTVEGSKYITKTKKRIKPSGVPRSRLVKPGDFLLTNSMSFGRPYIMKTHGCIHDGWLVLSPKKPNVDPNFFYHLLGSDAVYAEFSRLAAGATVKNLNIDLVVGVKVHLPPLPEQRRIAAILDQADALRTKRREALAKIDEMAQAIFVEMFVSNQDQKSWPSIELGNLCDLVRGSSPRPQGDPRFFGGPVPRLMISDITRDGMIVEPKIDSLTLEGAKRSRPMPAGSVVMAVSGAVGLPAILSVDACIHDGFVGFRNLDPRIRPSFLYHWLNFEKVRNGAKGTGAIWVNLTTDQVKGFLIPLPPISLQDKFMAVQAGIRVVRRTQSDLSQSIESLFTSLQHHAFSGTL